MKPKVLKSETKAEVLSVTLNYKGNKKVCFTTCHRVGTLGENNCNEISKHIQKISLNKSIEHHIIVGDFNLDTVNWENCSSTSTIQSRFLEIFDNHCFTQLISQPTHCRGKILDIFLTVSPHIISDVCINAHNEHVKSDHFSITFIVNLKVSIHRRKLKKSLRYNYKKAKWCAMNRFLHNIDWHNHIDYNDIFTCWNNFKNILSCACDQYIPTITVKDDRNLPWFDAEVHKLCIKKERLRSQYKATQKPEHYVKFSAARKDFKNLVKSKMRSNLCDPSNPNALTKKFWSYVKSNSNTSRIPTNVYCAEVHANDDVKQAELFNAFFYKQFSLSSNYEIDIDFSNDSFQRFKFEPHNVMQILKNIDINKSQGPDGINGAILKHCAPSLAFPLSILFNISYSSGQLPPDWKLANVVPVHKKGDKSDIENYRPISLTSLVMKVMEKNHSRRNLLPL